MAGASDIDVQYTHIKGCDNRTVELLSGWSGSLKDRQKLNDLVENAIWVKTHVDILELDWGL